MALSWKDAVTTTLAVGAGLITYAKYQHWQSWLTSPRLGVLALGVVGIAMCTTGAGKIPGDSVWSVVLSVMGGLALLLVAAGLITGGSWAFYALATDILALWLLTTLRHLGGLS